MTKEALKLLQEFSNTYDDISKITLSDYEQFLNEKIELKVDSEIIQNLRNLLKLYYLETEEHKVYFYLFLIRCFKLYNITYKMSEKDFIKEDTVKTSTNNKKRKVELTAVPLKKLRMKYVDTPLPHMPKEKMRETEDGKVRFI